VSHALRHEPWLYELELDERGWAPVDALLNAIHGQGPQWSDVDRVDLAGMIATTAKQRHEMDGERIRALYGHSLPGRLVRTEEPPPEVLFHGTSRQAWAAIQRTGLQPMGRQYVHLSVDVGTAEQLSRRKAPLPVILTVRARQAHLYGIRFWRGNELVWLADHVASAYLSAE